MLPGSFLKWMFLLMLFTPLAVVVVQRDRNFPRPKDFGELLLLPAELKHYFAAKFELRNRLAGLHSRIIGSVDGFDRSGDLVKVGQDGWLYFFLEKRNVGAFGQQDLAVNWKATAKIERKHRFCAERDIIYLPLIVPAKTSVYAERLPPRLARQLGRNPGEVTFLHRFLQTKSTGIRSVDLLAPFLRHKTNAPVYFRTDSHWTEYGAYIAAEEILGELRQTMTNLPPPYQPAPTFSYRETEAGNEARILGLQHERTEQYVHVHLPPETLPRQTNGNPVNVHAINLTGDFQGKSFHTRCDAARIPSVLVFQNSFGVALIPYLGRHFRQAHYAWLGFSEGLIEREQPTVVVEIFITL